MRFAKLSRRVVGAALLLAGCSPFQASPFDSDAAFKEYVSSLSISGVTGQAAVVRLRREGFECATATGVIASAPGEIVFLCQRAASGGGCKQDQNVVLQLDWVGTPKPELAPGMRVKTIGTAAGPKSCG
ncbi:MAG TPA: hypothetical protein VMR50_19265 [Myxococcota bacterium]|nr:hypothetical protein [Myxococcota bacterium]